MITFLSAWRLMTIMLTALSLGPALAHLLEMPAKITLNGALWLELLHTLYPPAFGTVGAFFEVGALISAIVLTILVRKRHPAFAWTLFGVILVKPDSVYSMLVGLKTEEIEELGERFLDAESLDEVRGWAEEKRMARAQ